MLPLRAPGRLVVSLVVSLVLALSLSACTGDEEPDTPAFTADLIDSDPLEIQQVALDNGVELALGTDGDEVVAQWRESDDGSWTEPATVLEGTGLEADQLEVVSGGDTAVAGVSWFAEDDDELENYARIDAAVCHDYTCEEIEDVAAAVPKISAEGDFAAVATASDAFDFAVWEKGSSGWDLVTIEGPIDEPDDSYDAFDIGLLGDGSFTTVQGRETEEGCTFELWGGDPRDTELSVVAATEPTILPGCSVESVQTDGTVVSIYNRTLDQQITFTPDGEGWSDDLPGSLPLAIDDNGGESGIAMLLTDREDGSTVAIGSPDLHRIVAQFRPAGATDWTRPVTLARSPAGQECHAARSETILAKNDVAYVVDCWPVDGDWGDEYDDAPPPTTGFAFGTSDGTTWATERLTRPAYDVSSQVSDPLLLVRGADRSVVWRPGARTFEEVTLPLPNPTVDGLAVIGDTAIRVTGNPDEKVACRPTWSIAPATGDSWEQTGDIRPIEDFARGPNDCYGVVIDREEIGLVDTRRREVRVAAVIESINGSIDGVLTRKGETWRFTGGS